MFTAIAPLTVAAGANVPVEFEYGDTNAFQEDGGWVSILNGGTYYAIFTVNVPAATAVNTQLSLMLNGETIFPSVTEINTDAAGTGGTYMGHAVFSASTGSTLALMTSGALGIPTYSAAPVVHLSIIRVG